MYLFSSFLDRMCYICGVRRPFVCKHLHKSLLLPAKWLDRHQICTPCDTGTFVISKKTKLLLLPGKWQDCDQIHSFANPPSLSTFPFFLHPIPKWLWICAVSSAIAHITKQFVKLFVIQYGLTFCLFVHTLWSTTTVSFQSQYQAAKSNI